MFKQGKLRLYIFPTYLRGYKCKFRQAGEQGAGSFNWCNLMATDSAQAMSKSAARVVSAASLDGGRRRWMFLKEGDKHVLRLNGGYTMRLSGITAVDGLEDGQYKLYFVVRLEKPVDWEACPVTFQVGAGRTRREVKDVFLGKEITNSNEYVQVPKNGVSFDLKKSEHRYVSFFLSDIGSDQWKEGLLVKEVHLVRLDGEAS